MNKYNSRTNTFMAADVFNQDNYYVPPADISVLVSEGQPMFMSYNDPTPAVFPGFEITDKPYIHAVGLFSNMADGLVSIPATNIYGTNGGLAVSLQLRRFAADLTGTIANTAGNAAIVGTATLFTQETAVGQTLWWLDDNNRLRSGVILTITNDTAIVLAAASTNAEMLTGNTTAAKASPQIAIAGAAKTLILGALNFMQTYGFFLGNVSQVKVPRGVITVVAASATVTGFGTFFTEDFATGDAFKYTDDLGVDRIGFVNTIVSNTSLTLAAVAPAGTDGTRAPFVAYDDELRIIATLPINMDFATLSIDPNYATRPLIFNIMAVIEHSRD